MSNRSNGEHGMWAGVKSAEDPQQKYVIVTNLRRCMCFARALRRLAAVRTCKNKCERATRADNEAYWRSLPKTKGGSQEAMLL